MTWHEHRPAGDLAPFGIRCPFVTDPSGDPETTIGPPGLPQPASLMNPDLGAGIEKRALDPRPRLPSVFDGSQSFFDTRDERPDRKSVGTVAKSWIFIVLRAIPGRRIVEGVDDGCREHEPYTGAVKPPAVRRWLSPATLNPSSPWCKSSCIRRAMHPRWRCCSLVQICRIFSLVAPGQRGASPVSVRRWTCTTGC